VGGWLEDADFLLLKQNVSFLSLLIGDFFAVYTFYSALRTVGDFGSVSLRSLRRESAALMVGTATLGVLLTACAILLAL
jgi:hypothetical protein